MHVCKLQYIHINITEKPVTPSLVRNRSWGEPHNLDKHDYPFSQTDLQMASMLLFFLSFEASKK